MGMGLHSVQYNPKEPSKGRGSAGRTTALSLVLLLLLGLFVLYPRLAGTSGGSSSASRQAAAAAAAAVQAAGPVLVSYSYFEKDPIQVSVCWVLVTCGGLCVPGC